jgi:thiol-disulfide isomerase/thioredoxin
VARILAAALLALSACAAAAGELKPWSGGATPPLALQDLAGRSHDLTQYRGKVVLVNFWATWCEPCRAEMPSMDRLRRSLEGQPFEVLAVNLAEPVSRIEKFVASMPLGFPLLLDRDSAVAKAWKARLLPASYLVGADGRIRYVALGELDWSGEAARRIVDQLLRESPSRNTRASAERSAEGANSLRRS